MTNREKVIKGLEMCLADEYCNGCPYEEDCFDPDSDNPWGTVVMRDALALLKEQEAVEPVFVTGEGAFFCGSCKFPLGVSGVNYCPGCGKAVKWT